MQLIKILDRVTFTSSDAGELSYDISDKIIDALSAKHAAAYVLVHQADSNTEVKIAYRHSPDGVNWATGANLYDSTTAIADGMNASDAGVDISFVAKMMPTVSINDLSTGGVTATLSAWIVLKPF